MGNVTKCPVFTIVMRLAAKGETNVNIFKSISKCPCCSEYTNV